MLIDISYTGTSTQIDTDTTLTIYDFGNAKGFLYKNDFTIYKILQKDFIENILHEHCEIIDTIPMNVYSIEIYPCVYENNCYTIPYYTISLSELPSPHVHPNLLPLVQHAQSSPIQKYQQPKVTRPQPVSQQPIQHSKKMPSSKKSEPLNEVNWQKPQVRHYQLLPSMHHNVQQRQWLSLDQVTRSPSPSVHQLRHSVQEQGSQYFQPLTHHSPVSQLRQPQKQDVKQNQYSKKKHSLPNPVQVLAQQ